MLMVTVSRDHSEQSNDSVQFIGENLFGHFKAEEELNAVEQENPMIRGDCR